MTNELIFKKNLELWSKQEPESGQKIESTEPKRVEFCEAANGALNLKASLDSGLSYYHDQNDPLNEAALWRKTLDLKRTNVLFVYGLGLGYSYDVLEEWLRASDRNYLAYIEDDPEVIRRFLETERAQKILQDRQVRLFLFEDFSKSAAKFDAVTSEFMGLEFKLSAIRPYLRNRAKELMHLNSLLSFLMKMKSIIHQEYSAFSVPFYSNFYMNLHTLPESYLGKGLWGEFQGVPAIICGAGPSLSKNIGVLKTLQNKALIFGGSTSINALNAEGIMPHFGVGIDPNPAQLTRIITNHAYQLPFFVNFRMNSFALNAIQGDHLYVNSTHAYDVYSWFDKMLGIEGPGIIEGYNVINYALAIAIQLGCNPIMLVGVDLAYSEGHSYAKLTPNHPLYQDAAKFQTKTAQEDLIARKDIYGKHTFTLWKWLMESVWFSKLAMEHPNLQLINATEGGIGFPGIPNRPLSEAAREHLNCSYDFEGMIHRTIQNSPMPPTVTHTKMMEGMALLSESLKRCEQACSSLVEEYKGIIGKISAGEAVQKNLITEKIAASVLQLDQQEGYQQILYAFNNHIQTILGRELKQLDMGEGWLSQEEILQQYAELHAMRFGYLLDAAQKNRHLLQRTLEVHQNQIEREKKFPHIDQRGFAYSELAASSKETYSLKDGILTLFDSALGIAYHEPFDTQKPENHSLEYYSDGSLKSEQFYFEEKLHGPSTFYAPNGSLLVRNWFYRGKRVGKGECFYPDGKLYSLTSYRNGHLHGPQNYYYHNGCRRTHLNYYDGILQGPLFLFYSNGQIKREIHYRMGKRHGEERLWNFEGKLIGETRYVEDKPTGEACFWSESGVLLKKVEFKAGGEVAKTSYYDEQGEPIAMQEGASSRDYFDSIALNMEAFTKNLDQIVMSLDTLVPLCIERFGAMSDSDFKDLKKDIQSVKKEVENLRVLNEKMKHEVGLDPNNLQEPIWKTPTMQDIFQDMMNKATENLKINITIIQSAFIEVIEKISLELGEDREKR